MTVVENRVGHAAGPEAFVKDALETHFGFTIEGWKARNGRRYHKRPGPDERSVFIGGFMRVEVTPVDFEGRLLPHVDIDDYNRPFPEDIIATLGQEALERAKGSDHLVWGQSLGTPDVVHSTIISDS